MAVWTTPVGRFGSRPAAVRIAPDEALRRLYDEQSQSLLRLATLLVWALVPEAVTENAEEIVHEAFAGMHREWRRLRDADKAVAYLRRAVVRSARLVAAAAHGDRAFTTATATDEMLAALRVMPGHQSEALVLRYYANLPEAQAADAMGVSRRAFRWYLGQGMTSLRAFLDQGSLSTARRGRPRLIHGVTHRVCTPFSTATGQRWPSAGLRCRPPCRRAGCHLAGCRRSPGSRRPRC
jgi:DNA-directed RNA polymerase specialized sigma24 family protein